MILDGQNVLKKHLFQNVFFLICNFQQIRSSWYNQEKNLYDFYSSIDNRLPKNSIQTIL